MLQKILLKSKSLARRAYAQMRCPLECLLCGEKTGSGLPVCAVCKTEELFLPLEYRLHNPDKFCKACGRFLISEAEYCTACRAKVQEAESGGAITYYDKVFTLYPYQGHSGKIVREWKNKNVRGLSELFAKAVFQFINARSKLAGIPIVPVPPRPRKLKVKSWDQIEDMAEILEGLYGLNVLRCLKRRDGLSQKSLSKKERKTNLKGKIGLKNNGSHLPDTLIVLDDVMTTGATLDFCAKALKEAGCKKVFGLCLFFD